MPLHPLIQSYKAMMDFLGEILGRNYEIVLHVNDGDDGFHVEKIVNGHVSHRTIHSPMTNYGLKLIEDQSYLKTDYKTHYSVLTENGQKLFGSTFFIKEDNELLGMLCINTDHYHVSDVLNNLLALIPGGEAAIEVSLQSSHPEANEVEVLANDVTDIIRRAVTEAEAKMPHVESFKKNDKISLIRELKDKGIFQIKGAIPKVANILHISAPSVYRYLSELKQEEQDAKNENNER